MGLGYCHQKLIISRNNAQEEQGYDIRGGYLKFVDDDSVTMSWGVTTTGPGLNDTVVANGIVPSRWDSATPGPQRLANLHYIIEKINGVFTFEDFSLQKCNQDTGECSQHEEFVVSQATIKNTSVRHQIVNFDCYGYKFGWSTECVTYVYL